MSKCTVRTVYERLNEIAPFETSESYDNTGLLIGDWDAAADRILCSLDVTADTVAEAVKYGAQLIVSHHPLMFHGTKRLIKGDPESDVIASLLRHGISLISAHTNMDQTFLSGSASVARGLQVNGLRQSGYLFTGDFERPVAAGEIVDKIRNIFAAPVRLYGDPNKRITTMSFAGGAYGEGYLEALGENAQAYLTGEFRHHEIIDGTARGLCLFEMGHYASEAPMIPGLCQYLRERLPDGVMISETCSRPFYGAITQVGGPT